MGIDLQWATTLLEHPGYRRYKTKEPAALPADYFGFLQQLPLKKMDDQLENEAMGRFLGAYGSHLLPDGQLSADPAAAERLYAQATADLGPTRARDQAVYRLLTDQLVMGNAAALGAYPTFRAQNRDSARARQMHQLVGKLARLQPGQPAPAFRLRDAGGKEVALSDFKSKVVYLDFWASWCGPCLAEVPAGAALKKQFAGRDVVFLYISIDRRAADWQKALAAHPLTDAGSVHLLNQETWPGSAGDAYQATAIPSYWLIGRDGRIRLAHAPRPSAGPETVAALEQALRAPSAGL